MPNFVNKANILTANTLNAATGDIAVGLFLIFFSVAASALKHISFANALQMLVPQTLGLPVLHTFSAIHLYWTIKKIIIYRIIYWINGIVMHGGRSEVPKVANIINIHKILSFFFLKLS